MVEKGYKILIVEDESDIAEIYSLQLKNAGFTISIAKNGQEALDYLKQDIPDLILLDLLMPDMDGYEFLNKIKNLPDRKKFLTYAWSNLTQKKDIELAKKRGVDGFLIKSDYAPKALVEKVKEIFNK